MKFVGVRKSALAFAFALAVFVSILTILEVSSGYYISHLKSQGKSVPREYVSFATIPRSSEKLEFALKTDFSHLRHSQFDQLRLPFAAARKENHGIWYTDPKTKYMNLIPNFQRKIEATSLDDGQVIYSALYNIDEHSRRRVPPPQFPQQVKSHLIVSGCSFVFGEGINEEDTLPGILQQKTSDFRVYNLGRKAGSIADAIATITIAKNWENIAPVSGTVLVSFMADVHIKRFLGSMTYIGGYGSSSAFIDVDPLTGRYVYKGRFGRKKPAWTAVSRILVKSDFLRLMRFEWPLVGKNEFRSYAKAIDDLRFYYQQKFGAKNRVIVFFNPDYPNSRGIIPFLEELQIPYLDYSQLIMTDFATAQIDIPRDGHPTREYNRILADLIYRDLTNPENQSRLEKFEREKFVSL